MNSLVGRFGPLRFGPLLGILSLGRVGPLDFFFGLLVVTFWTPLDFRPVKDFNGLIWKIGP